MAGHYSGPLFQFGGAPVGAEELLMAGGNWYYFDPTNGLSANPGTKPNLACSDLKVLYAKLRSGHNDGIIFLGGATAYNPTAAFTWNKPYTHLIGVDSPLPGQGQRCRIVGTAANALVEVFTISVAGCVFKNLQFFNGANTAIDAGAVGLTSAATRNVFINCFFAGMGDATASGPATRTGGYSLTLTSSGENAFYNCTIGLDTVVRSAANSEMILAGPCPRNKFFGCEFLSASETTGKFLISITGSADRDTVFRDCLFRNFSVNHAAKLSNAISDAATTTHEIILLGDNELVGVTGWADVVTYIFGGAPVPNAGYGIAVNPTT